MLNLVKFQSKNCNDYIDLLKEFKDANSDLIPDILELKCDNKSDYSNILNEIKNRENGIHNDLEWYKNGYYFLAYDNINLIGIGCIRKNLTKLGYDIWGNIAYGVRPTKRNKGFATEIATQLVQKCKEFNINEIVLCHYIDNLISPKIFNKIGAKYTNTIISPYSGKSIKRYIMK